MSKMFYSKIALTNIKKNYKFNIPYMLTCIGTIAMFYIMGAITNNSGMEKMPSAGNLKNIMNMGCVVIAIFAVIFLFYTNSFLMKRRKNEIGLYNILGMEKKHISRILCYETMFMAIIGLAGGFLCGIVFNKLITMLFSKLVSYNVVLNFEIVTKSIIYTVVLFVAIFTANLVFNLAKIQMAKPIELLNGGNVGEKEPKTKFIMSFLGIALIAAAYTIANIITSPLEALVMFFVAVLMVVVGTYFLFVAGSIVVLKLLRRNKKHYYKTKHFTNISGMIYRMKQNAVGLANICILSTMVLVMLSTTVSMYIGVDDSLNNRFPSDISIGGGIDKINKEENSELLNEINKTVRKSGRKLSGLKEYTQLSFATYKEDSKYDTSTNTNIYTPNVDVFSIMTADDYNKLENKDLKLKGDEVLVYDAKNKVEKEFSLLGMEFRVKERPDSFLMSNNYSDDIMTVHYIVVANSSIIEKLADELKGKINSNDITSLMYNVEFNLDGTDEQIIKCYENIVKNTKDKVKGGTRSCKQSQKESFYSMYGCLLFLGIFLGTLFLMATVLIIYYKQISEGYDDKQRFEIMQKVGMSKSEVWGTIRSQVLGVFFLPILVAGIHVMAAFNMITKLLAVMNLTNVTLFAWCTLGTIVVFAAIYGFVYSLTAKVYYNIVER